MKKTIYICGVLIIIIAALFYLQTNSSVHIVAVGDIARKNGKQADVARLISSLHPDKVLVLGDTAYQSGTAEEFATLYDPTFGAFKNKTAPSPGNHEYLTKDASGYYDYFGQLAGPDRRGYYSFDMGSWHLISLNSERMTNEQLTWLEKDLNLTSKPCILAYWHKPFLSSGGEHGPDPEMKAFWDLLYIKGADLVLNGHEHNYERLVKVNPQKASDEKGIREIVVGTGGAEMYGFGNPIPSSEIRKTGSYGALELDLKKNSYSAEFKSTDNSFSDTFEGTCND